MATGPLAGAQPDSLEHSVWSLVDAEADNAQAGIEFGDMRYFAAVAEELHFGRRGGGPGRDVFAARGVTTSPAQRRHTNPGR